MSDEKRIGIIGTGRAAGFIKKLRESDGAVVSAICGRRQEAAEEVAKEHGIPEIYVDYAAMYEQGGLDGVLVAAPDDLHYPMTMAALEAGIHVLCEKPLAMNVAEAEEMLETAESKGLIHMTYLSRRKTALFVHLGELLRKGFIGEWREFTVNFMAGMLLEPTKGAYMQEYFRKSRSKQWKADPTRSNGALSLFGAHIIDMVLAHLDDIESVSASLTTYEGAAGYPAGSSGHTNDSALLLVNLAGGAHGTIHASFVSHVWPRIDLTVYGEEGVLVAEQRPGGKTWLRYESATEGSDHEIEIPDETQNLPDICSLFIDSIRDGKGRAPTFEDGLKVQRVIDAAIESSSTGERVDLSIR